MRELREPEPAFLLDAEPDLGVALREPQREEARAVLRAPALHLGEGSWEISSNGHVPPGGALIRSGFIVRTMRAGERPSSRILGPGDAIQPWREDTHGPPSEWRVLQPAMLLLLDADLLWALRAWPAVAAALFAAWSRQVDYATAHVAIGHQTHIEDRLLRSSATSRDAGDASAPTASSRRFRSRTSCSPGSSGRAGRPSRSPSSA